MLAVLLLLAACTSAPAPQPERLRVVASSELADMGPVLEELTKATGIELVVEHRGTVEASALELNGAGFDLAWLSTSRFLRLRGEVPLSTSTMLSPIVLGVKPGKVGERATWADIADRAALGELRFGMADPRVSGGGMAALIGVATAAAGTGSALRPEDVRCDKIQGFLAGRAFDSRDVLDEFARRQSEVDGVVAHESEVLALNASGRLKEPLRIVYPRDGIVLSDYPLMLVRPEKRAAYDRVVEWLKSPAAQQLIMEKTWRRPVDASVRRVEALREPLGSALYFPDQQQVIDRLLESYDRVGTGRHVVFVLDYSTSMRGERMARLREAFAKLNGFDRFYVGEKVAIVRFAGEVLEERAVTVSGKASLDELAGVVASEDLRDHTAIWSALRRGYELAPASVVLMTDGENNAGASADEVLAGPKVPTYPIRFGEADLAELDKVARATGGRVVDATTSSLLEAVREIRGCR